MRMPCRRLRRFAAARGGTTAVEFALVALPLIMLLAGTMMVGVALYMRSDLAYAADRAVRVLLLDPDAGAAEATATVRDAVTGPAADAVEVRLEAADAAAGTLRSLTVSFPMTLSIPGLPASEITLQVTRALPD